MSNHQNIPKGSCARRPLASQACLFSVRVWGATILSRWAAIVGPWRFNHIKTPHLICKAIRVQPAGFGEITAIPTAGAVPSDRSYIVTVETRWGSWGLGGISKGGSGKAKFAFGSGPTMARVSLGPESIHALAELVALVEQEAKA